MLGSIKTFIRKFKTLDLTLYFLYTRFIFAKETVYSLLVDFLINMIKKRVIKVDIQGLQLTNKSTVLELNDGRKFYWNPKDRTSLIGLGLKGTNQKEEIVQMKKIIKLGDTVFDIGANFGFHAVLFSQFVGKTGRVYSFEPIKKMCLDIKEHLELNSIGENVFLNNVGLGSKAEKLKIYYYPELGTGLASLRKYWIGRPVEETISLITLDSYVKRQGIKKIDFIKCNVEGSEFIVFQGAKETLKKFKPPIMFEVTKGYSDAFGYTREELLDYLASFGYKFYVLSSGKLAPLKQSDIPSLHGNCFAFPKSKKITL